MNPLPQGTILNIQITYQGQVFAAGGVVARSHPNMGIHVKFITLESGCASILEAWLHEVGLVQGRTNNSDCLFCEVVALMRKPRFNPWKKNQAAELD